MALRKCPRCDGDGYIRGGDPFSELNNPDAEIDNSLVGMVLDSFVGVRKKCPLCHGTGYIDDGAIEIHVRHKYDE